MKSRKWPMGRIAETDPFAEERERVLIQVASLNKTKPPPCEGCEYYQHCKTAKTACGLFYKYVHGSHCKLALDRITRAPSTHLYSLLFPGEQDV